MLGWPKRKDGCLALVLDLVTSRCGLTLPWLLFIVGNICWLKALVKRAWELTSKSLCVSFFNFLDFVNREEFVWELTNESLYDSFLNSHVLVKWEQELCESWWELTSESLYESFLNSYVLVKRKRELMRDDKREFVWKLSQLSRHFSVFHL